MFKFGVTFSDDDRRIMEVVKKAEIVLGVTKLDVCRTEAQQ